MAQFITVQMEDGSEVYIQTVNVPKKGARTNQASVKDEVVYKTKELFDKAMPQITEFAKTAKKSFEDKMGNALPNEIELEFSIGMATDASIVFASTEMSAGMILHMKWNLKDEEGK